ncbi:hypothetical protein BT69DRAFT_814175 [Atractiella rhizophila]|nr:hypothetical protein BT69DRAFT_814175 [Atractiella rhizophila]
MFQHPLNWSSSYTEPFEVGRTGHTKSLHAASVGGDYSPSTFPASLPGTAINAPSTSTHTTLLPRLRIAKACDRCRKRRAKCTYDADRLPPPISSAQKEQDVTCANCRSKGVKCTFEYWKSKTAKEEADKRNMRKGAGGRGQLDLPEINLPVPFQKDLIPNSPERGLVVTELEAQLYGTLLQLQKRCIKTPLTEFLYPNLLDRWYGAGGRLSQMSCPEEQISAACMMYIGSRYSPHSSIVGTEHASKEYEAFFHSNPSEVATVENSYAVGTARETFCGSILNFAVKKCDEVGLLRKPTVESLVTLIVLESVVDAMDYTCKIGRPYILAAASHFRSCVDLAIRPEVLRRLAPAIFGRDAFSAVASGDALALSDDDVKMMFRRYPYGLDMFLLPSSSAPHSRKLDDLSRFGPNPSLDDQYVALVFFSSHSLSQGTVKLLMWEDRQRE